ncbi:MAG: di-trans,poly-cis-decaprenylcistransferase [Bacteroidales bacterium]|nr:di-trans,poly-cis-decaprenylcistransferase [Bacteroidales bacterium]
MKAPRHVTIIMDGNGRWARQKGKDRLFGHAEGVESIRSVLRAAHDAGVEYLSFYAFSEENWGRPEGEVAGLMELMLRSLKSEEAELKANKVHLRILGNLGRLSPELQEAVKVMDENTAPGAEMTMILFISYSGRWDIAQAARRMAEEGGESIEPYLVTAGVPDPDLLIRTSGEQRVSNYLLWQLAYTEFVFTPVLWPDFRREQFFEALEEYSSRERRFGKVK